MLAFANNMFVLYTHNKQFGRFINIIPLSIDRWMEIRVRCRFITLNLNLFSFSHKNKLNCLTLHSDKQHILSPLQRRVKYIVQTSDQKFTFSIKNNDTIQFLFVFIYKLRRFKSNCVYVHWFEIFCLQNDFSY